MQSALQPSQCDELARRSREVKLLLWWQHDEKLTPGETGQTQLDRWLHGTALQEHVRDAIHDATHKAGDPQPAGTAQPCAITPFPGCTLWRIATRGPRALWAMALTGAAYDSQWFTQTCAASQVAREQVEQALGPWLHDANTDLALLMKTLRWSWHDLTSAARDEQAIEQFSEKLSFSYEQMQVLFRLFRFLNAQEEPEDVMRICCEQLHSILPFGWVVLCFGSLPQVIEPVRGRMLIAGQLPCDHAAFFEQSAALVEALRADTWLKLLQPGGHPLATLVNSEVAVEPITHAGQPVGVLLAGGKTGDDAEMSSNETQFLDAAADLLGVFHENAARFLEQRSLFMGTLKALTSSIDAKDPYTCGHFERVAYLSATIAQAMGMDKQQIEQIRIAGLLHDVGKIGVPEMVLCKPGQLSDREFAQIKRHPAIGHAILKVIPPLTEVLSGVMYHHERWDGKGYPEGLGGDAIPLYGRLLALADAFDAMSTNRAYRPARPREEVLSAMQQAAGTQFDPQLVEQFLQLDFSEYDRMLENHSSQTPMIDSAA